MLRHEALTSLTLLHGTAAPSWARRVVAGHHGRYQSVPACGDDALVGLRRRTLEPPWAAAQGDLVGQVLSAVETCTGQDPGFARWPVQVDKRLVPYLVVLTGLVSTIDWVVSDVTFLRAAPLHLLDEPAEYLARRSEAVGVPLRTVFAGSAAPTGDFAALFGGRSPRGGAQEWAARRRHGPGLVVVMAPMGEGKTEVALQIHTADSRDEAGTGTRDALFFGLPTAASAEAMFDRVREFWDGVRAVARLAHAQAVLHDFYAPADLRPLSTDRPADGLVPSDWLLGRHRSLLAPVVVGTCDQVLAAALAHKYLPVRLAALAGKHVVLDEVHTYDPYQHRLLGWLAAFGCRVTLLSATLPQQRVAELVSGWTDGRRPGTPAWKRPGSAELLAGGMSYPAVVAGQDAFAVTPLAPWRSFELELRCHQVSPQREQGVGDTVRLLRELRRQHPQARLGLVVNTVDRAVAVARALAGDDGELLVLHSRMAAGQRRQRTRQLTERLGRDARCGPVLVVGTQVIEASLDLDLDVLVSDLAPVSALLQRSGRLWRHSVPDGSGWRHPDQLAYRRGNPVLHVLAALDDRQRPVSPLAALPYTSAELTKAWREPQCLHAGERTRWHIPGDLQAAVDAAHVSLEDLDTSDEEADRELQEQVLRHLGAGLSQAGAADRTGVPVGEIARTWDEDSDSRWPSQGPDWSGLTWPRLWDDDAVTRLRERDQVRLLLVDPSGHTRWAWHGELTQLTGAGTSRDDHLLALSATVPVSGTFARRLRQLVEADADPDAAAQWQRCAPALLRGLLPAPVAALHGVARLDPDLGLVPVEDPCPPA